MQAVLDEISRELAAAPGGVRIDELATKAGGEQERRLFVYQRNIERLIRHPLEIQENVLEILQRELDAHFTRPSEAPAGVKFTSQH